MMEKQGIVAPHVTPPEDGDTAKTAAQITQVCEKPEVELQAIRELDGDFRKAAAEATTKSLR
jgi:hypothetical protein